MDLAIEVASDADRTIVRLEGGCDLAEVPRLREVLAPLVPPEVNELVIDVSELQMLDDTGLGVLLGALRRQRERGGRLKLAGAGGPVLESLRLTGLTEILPLYDDVGSATADRIDGLG